MNFCFGLIRFRQKSPTQESSSGENPVNTTEFTGPDNGRGKDDKAKLSGSYDTITNLTTSSITPTDGLPKSSRSLTVESPGTTQLPSLNPSNCTLGPAAPEHSGPVTPLLPTQSSLRPNSYSPRTTDDETGPSLANINQGNAAMDIFDRAGQGSAEYDNSIGEHMWSQDIFASQDGYPNSRNGASCVSRRELDCLSSFLSNYFGAVDVQKLVGTGAYGRVYKGTLNDEVVAVKVVKHQLQEGPAETSTDLAIAHKRVLEGLIAVRVRHEHIVQTIDIVVQGGDPKTLEKLRRAALDSNSTTPSAKAVACSCLAAGSFTGLSSNCDTDVLDAQGEQPGPYKLGGVVLAPGSDATSVDLYIIQEFCSKGCLKDALRDGVFHVNEPAKNKQVVLLSALLDTALEIAKALEHLHMLRYVHGDLKTDNILLQEASNSRGFTAKVADFGMTRILQQGEEQILVSKFGAVSHMPPETLRDSVMTFSSDVYSFGIILWELYCAAKPFAHYSPFQLLNAVVQYDERPKFPAHCPPLYQKLAVACMSKTVAERPTFHKVVATLMQLQQKLDDRQVVDFQSACQEINRCWESHISTVAELVEASLLPRQTQTSREQQMQRYMRTNSGLSWGRGSCSQEPPRTVGASTCSYIPILAACNNERPSLIIKPKHCL